MTDLANPFEQLPPFESLSESQIAELDDLRAGSFHDRFYANTGDFVELLIRLQFFQVFPRLILWTTNYLRFLWAEVGRKLWSGKNEGDMKASKSIRDAISIHHLNLERQPQSVYVVTSELGLSDSREVVQKTIGLSWLWEALTNVGTTHWGIVVKDEFYDLERNGRWPFATTSFEKSPRSDQTKKRVRYKPILLGHTHFSQPEISEFGRHLMGHHRIYSSIFDNCQTFAVNRFAGAILCEGRDCPDPRPTNAFYSFCAVSLLRKHLFRSIGWTLTVVYLYPKMMPGYIPSRLFLLTGIIDWLVGTICAWLEIKNFDPTKWQHGITSSRHSDAVASTVDKNEQRNVQVDGKIQNQDGHRYNNTETFRFNNKKLSTTLEESARTEPFISPFVIGSDSRDCRNCTYTQLKKGFYEQQYIDHISGLEQANCEFQTHSKKVDNPGSFLVMWTFPLWQYAYLAALVALVLFKNLLLAVIMHALCWFCFDYYCVRRLDSPWALVGLFTDDRRRSGRVGEKDLPLHYPIAMFINTIVFSSSETVDFSKIRWLIERFFIFAIRFEYPFWLLGWLWSKIGITGNPCDPIIDWFVGWVTNAVIWIYSRKVMKVWYVVASFLWQLEPLFKNKPLDRQNRRQ